MARALPAVPLFLFGVIEPLLLVWAYIVCLRDPFAHYAAQVPNTSVAASDFQPQALAVTLMLNNVLLLLAAMALVCCWTHNPSTCKWYLISVAFADFGHIYASYAAMGDAFWNFSQWNDMIWGNVGVSLFLNVFRWLSLLGAFGNIGVKSSVEKKRL